MYKPAAFLISITALTSIFSFFFGGYFRERARAYQLWLKYVAYGQKKPEQCENIEICAELESKNRMFYHAKGLLIILIITIIIDFIVFQFYSYQFVCPESPRYDPFVFKEYLSFSIIMAIIVIINGLELIYIQVAITKISYFPFFKLRRRVTGQDRLSKVWMLLGCSKLKEAEYNGNTTRIITPQKTTIKGRNGNLQSRFTACDQTCHHDHRLCRYDDAGDRVSQYNVPWGMAKGLAR